MISLFLGNFQIFIALSIILFCFKHRLIKHWMLSMHCHATSKFLHRSMFIDMRHTFSLLERQIRVRNIRIKSHRFRNLITLIFLCFLPLFEAFWTLHIWVLKLWKSIWCKAYGLRNALRFKFWSQDGRFFHFKFRKLGYIRQ